MNTDDRILVWRALFSSDDSFEAVGSPYEAPWCKDLLESANGGGDRVLVVFGPHRGEVPNLDSYASAVIVNGAFATDQALRASGLSHIRRFAVVPGLKDVRWLVPLGNRRISSAAFDLYSPYTISAKLKLAFARGMANSGLRGWYRDHIVVARRKPGPLERLMQIPFPEKQLEFAISAGTSGASRKPTIAILDENGSTLGLAKVSQSSKSRLLVEHEAKCLAELNNHAQLAGSVPKLLHAAETGGNFVAIQSPLGGKPGSPKFGTAEGQLLAKLRRTSRIPISSTSIAAQVHCQLPKMGRSVLDVAKFADLLRLRFCETRLPQTITHGDFAPWNLRVHGDSVRAFDWEYAELDGLPLLDELHHHIQTGLLLHGWQSDHIENWLLASTSKQAASLSITVEETELLQLLYLIRSIALRKDEGTLPAAGTSKVLEEVLGRSARRILS